MDMTLEKICLALALFIVTICKSQEISTKPASGSLYIILPESISITCIYPTDADTIKWYRGSEKLEQLGFLLSTRAYVNSNNQAVSEVTATKANSTASDIGEYKCVAGGKQVNFHIKTANSQEITVEPPFSVIYINAPAAINLTCKYSGNLSPVQWIKDNTNVDLKGFNIQSKKTTSNNTHLTEVVAVKPESAVEDSGDYRCTVGSKSFPVKVVVFTVNVTETEYTGVKMNQATLGCDPNIPIETPSIKYHTKWQRNYKDITELEDFATKYTVHENNFTLDINDVDRSDADAYQCVVTFNDSQPQELSITVNLFASTFVKSFDKSKNLIQGDPLQLKCSVLGHPLANITWMKDEVVLDASERIKFKLFGGIDNALLEITVLEFEDKGSYMCIASSSKFPTTSNSTIVVRVKDKLAALWPFLGIVAEVIILCIIIFIYEKKRSKDESVDEDDTTVKGGSTNAAEPNEVRQRNVRT